MQNYIDYKQYDLQWALQRFSKANLTIKDKGCVIASLANLAVWYGKETDPGHLAKLLKFTRGGNVYWQSFTDVFKDIKYIRAYKWADTSADIKTIDSLLLQWPLLVETRVGWRRKQMHWVIIWKKENGRYVMSDPLSNSTDFLARYKDPKRWIYGIRLFKAKKLDPTIKIKNTILEVISIMNSGIIKLKEVAV